MNALNNHFTCFTLTLSSLRIFTPSYLFHFHRVWVQAFGLESQHLVPTVF
jgi:hypothetical protein